MAIKISKKEWTEVSTLAKRLHIDPAFLQWLSNCGWRLDVTATKLDFYHLTGEGKDVSLVVSVMIPVTEFSLFMAGDAADVLVQSVQSQMREAIKTVFLDFISKGCMSQTSFPSNLSDTMAKTSAWVENAYGLKFIIDVDGKVVIKEYGISNSQDTEMVVGVDLGKSKDEDKEDKIPGKESLGENQMAFEQNLNIPTVPLKDAKRLFQPVMGSGKGSRYYAIAIGEGIAVAVRIASPSGVSIRIEGAKITKLGSKLEKAGFTLHGSQENPSHYSVHFEADGQLAHRAIGSLIFGSGLNFKGVATNLAAISGA